MRIFIAVAVSLSVASLIVAFLGWGGSARDREEAALRPIEEELTRLSQESRRIETRVGEMARRLDPLESAARRGGEAEAKHRASEGPDPQEEGRRRQIEVIAATLGELEAKLEDVESKANRTPVAAGGAGATETDESRKAIVAENQAIAVDRTLSPQSRLVALRALRGRGGRSKEVTQAMVELILDPGLESRLRADMIRNLNGVDFPELKQTLLTVLQNDTDSETRSETVETLQVFYGDAAVHAAVVQVRDHDADADVRAEAARRLAQFEDRGQRR